jgi:IQ calmodulin-binding motif
VEMSGNDCMMLSKSRGGGPGVHSGGLRKKSEIVFLRSQNHFAAQQIQRALRGYLCRRSLWKYTGVLTQHMATKIQKTWRGYLGIPRRVHTCDLLSNNKNILY